MRIGFYAPLKAPDHPVPSGDRQVARLLLAALERAGLQAGVISTFRSWTAAPGEPPLEALEEEAGRERRRLAAAWADPGIRPDLLFTYHPYYKAPDLLGPRLAARFGLPYVTAEASLSSRRAEGPWASRQAVVEAGLRRARLNLCLTARDRAGLAAVIPDARLADLPPFIDLEPFARAPAKPAPGGPVRLVTVAMMRAGDKLASYHFLAAALARLDRGDWTLTVVGDGPARAEVEAALAPVAGDRLAWAGLLTSGSAVARHLAGAEVFVWPGINEAFGLCYLEAQAAGLPVVAIDGAGVPAVVRHDVGGLLAPPEPDAYAAALDRLIADPALRQALGAGGRAQVRRSHGLPAAAARLGKLLRATRAFAEIAS